MSLAVTILVLSDSARKGLPESEGRDDGADGGRAGAALRDPRRALAAVAATLLLAGPAVAVPDRVAFEPNTGRTAR